MSVRTIDTVVSSLSTERKMSKAGKPFTLHYVTTDDGEKINVGFKQDYRAGDKFNVDVELKFGELKLVGPATGTPTKAPSKSNAPSTGSPGFASRVFPVPELSGEMSIIRQNALTNARELVATISGNTPALLAADATKAERDQFYDALVEDVLRIAYKFADFSSGHREVKMARQQSRLADSE